MKFKYKIVLIVMVCYLVAWLDRMSISMAIPFMMKDLNFSATSAGTIMSAFFFSYSLFQMPGGFLSDKIGPRKVITGALIWWSAFTALTGSVSSLVAMLVIRFCFGIGEGCFPGPVFKVIGNWFSKKDVATVNMLVLSTTALGPALTPMIVAPLLSSYGWRTLFWILGACGLVCVALSWYYIRNKPHDFNNISAAEIAEHEAEMQVDALAAQNSVLGKATLGQLMKSPAIWILFISVLTLTTAMYGYMTWLPTYLMKVRGLSLVKVGLMASVPFFFAAIGMGSAGWISDKFFANKRKVLVIMAELLGAFSLYQFYNVADMMTAQVWQCIAAFGLYLALGAVWTLPVLIVPQHLMGSGAGFVNMGGQLGGFIAPMLIGFMIDWFGGDFAAGFNVLVGSVLLSALIVTLFVKQKKMMGDHSVSA